MIQKTNSGTRLNKYWIPGTAPIAQDPPIKSGIDFRTLTDRGAVVGYNLGNFSFNSGTGGTITLGGSLNGTTNVNGLLRVKDSGNNEVVRADYRGLTVTNGSIFISDSSGSTIIDSQGLNSLNNFSFYQAFDGTSTNMTTSTSYVDLPNGTIGTVILTRDVISSMYLYVYGQNTNIMSSLGTDIGFLGLWDSFLGDTTTDIPFGGHPITYTPDGTNFYEYTSNEAVGRSSLILIQAGTHVYKMRYRADVGGTAVISTFEGDIIIYGQ